ncbi:MAG: sensor hybrid histidine kinase [Bryobacterales bacterium]|nr:sensor hybrid histidine kinase [Bryobacterales bacterium]
MRTMQEGTALSISAKALVEKNATVKLLLVDDDQDNLLALQAILEPLQQELMLAQNGTDALRLCLEHDFAAILLDVRMPVMDGFETAEMIRARKKSLQTPILFLTAYRSDEQLFRGYNLGAVDFLFKPIVPEILQSKVNVFVELRRTEQLLRRKAEQLARAEQRFRAVLEAAPDAMMITNQAGIIELANSRADTLFGRSREALIGRDIHSLLPAWECPDEDLLLPGLPQPTPEQRLTAHRDDGSVFPAEITRNSFHTPDGLLITTAIRDATDQVDAETKIQKTNLELEKRVAERTAALRYSNEALRQFAWAASHDLQEPIRTVVTYSQWLAKIMNGNLGVRESKMLATIEQHASRLNQLLAALRQYIQVSDSGQHSRVSVDCNAIVKAAAWNLQGMIEENGASVECGTLPTIASLELPLVQLFQNLISNAIKYRSEVPPVIRISAEAGENCWVFSVQDNGIGIDPKYFDYIFGVFRRLHGAQKSGTGIGLAICRAAVERLGGRIWVESTPGSGSTFFVSLPL